MSEAVDYEHYQFTNGWTMRREEDTLWCLRDGDGVYVDRDKYRFDIISRHSLSVSLHYMPRRCA